MNRLPGFGRELISIRPRRRSSAFASQLLAVFVLSLFGFLAVELAGPRPATAADATTSPMVPGQHVYDYGDLLSAQSVKTAETLAAQIEAAGGGRIVLYTGASASDIPFTLAQDWSIDGLLLTGEGDYGIITVGATLKGKLGARAELLSSPPPGEPTVESWMLTTLARADGLLGGKHVFDATGILDATGRQHAEAAATDLAAKLGAPVYVDIAIAGSDPNSDVSFNASMVNANLGKCLVIALEVSDGQIAGEIDADGSLFGHFHTGTPWIQNSVSSGTVASGDVQGALLSAIDAVQSGSAPAPGSTGGGGMDWELIFWIVFAIVMVLVGVGSPFYGSWLIRKLSGATGPIKGGLPGDAVIESIADTGVTVTMPSVGPNAPEYKFGLQVTPVGGGTPYRVETKAIVPRIYIPMVVPGAQVGVLIDPIDPQKVSIDFSQMGGSAAAGGAAAGGAAGGMDFQFDANGQPTAGEVSGLVGAVRSGTLPTINKGSADQLLATGTHGTAVITSAQPLGKTVRDINPKADPSRLNDPVWVFTVEVTVAGEKPFPAVFGHRVPVAKVASVAPGVKLAIAVNMSDRHNEVAIDWDKSPIGA